MVSKTIELVKEELPVKEEPSRERRAFLSLRRPYERSRARRHRQWLLYRRRWKFGNSYIYIYIYLFLFWFLRFQRLVHELLLLLCLYIYICNFFFSFASFYWFFLCFMESKKKKLLINFLMVA